MASRQTKVLGGSLAQAQSFTLDPGLFQYVQSVLVEVDNTAGPDVTPTLTVSTVNGTPIADKTQGSVIPAGDTGRATWALRLTDEGGGGSGLVTASERFSATTAGVPANAATALKWTHLDGSNLTDLTNPLAPKMITAGLYEVTTDVVSFAVPQVGKHWAANLQLDTSSPNSRTYMTGNLDDAPPLGGANLPSITLTRSQVFTANQVFNAYVMHNAAAALSFIMSAWIQQIG